MAQVGVLGDIVFSVSANTVKTISNMQWSGSARYGEHQRHLTHALTEFTGLAPDDIFFDIALSAYLGVNPQTEMEKIWEYERSGRAIPLVLGYKTYGKYRWVIKSHRIKLQNFDRDGNLTSAIITVNLLEYLKS